MKKIGAKTITGISTFTSAIITPEQLTRLQAFADNAQTVADNLTAQAVVSKAIASKGVVNPVPVPVPEPTPV